MLRKQFQLDADTAVITLSETIDNRHIAVTVQGAAPEPVVFQLDYQGFQDLCGLIYRLDVLDDQKLDKPNLAIAA